MHDRGERHALVVDRVASEDLPVKGAHDANVLVGRVDDVVALTLERRLALGPHEDARESFGPLRS